MVRVFAFLLSLISADQAHAQPAHSPDGIDRFFSVVSTGTAAEVAEALKREPALATARDRYGFQPIHVLDYADFEEKARLLLRYGADINAQNDEGTALLHILIDPVFLSVVLDLGGDIEIRDAKGRTPLLVHLEEPEGLDMVEALLSAGADPNAKDHRDMSASDRAKLRQEPRAVSLLRSAGLQK